MIIHTTIDPTKVTTYHTQNAGAIARIKSRGRYGKLRASIKSAGVKDPVIVRCEKGWVYVECGEERVLIACELGIDVLDAIVYDTRGGVIPYKGTRLTSVEDVEACFPRVTYSETTHPICSLCGTDLGERTQTVPVPALKMILDYIASGVATL